MRFIVVIEPDHEVGGFNVVVPALPGCFTQGVSIGQCLVRAQDAIATYLEGESAESLRAAGVDPDLVIDMAESQCNV